MQNKLIMAALLLGLTHCSVYMAATAPKDPKLDVIQVGATRHQIENALGTPTSLAALGNGEVVSTYEVEIGRHRDTRRAITYGAADILTLGLWEAVGTPIEVSNKGEKRNINVVYDQTGRVKVVD